MSTFFTDIQAAMRVHLSTMPDLPPVAWENFEYKEDAKTLYFRADFIPADTIQDCLGDEGQDYHEGIFQIRVFVPNGKGRTEWPDDIADHFRRGLVLAQNGVNVRIRNTSLATPIKDQNFYIVPVEVRYESVTDARS